MSGSNNFLTRWSRRKRDITAHAIRQKAEQNSKSTEARQEVTALSASDLPAAQAGGGKQSSTPVDLSTLPSFESINADTKMDVFLGPTVPPDLARAALRRAWSADPAVRDFVGLQENDWAFNPPGAAQGFGPLGPEHDVGKLLAQVFGEAPKTEDDGSASEQSKPNSANAAIDPSGQPTTTAIESAAADKVVPASPNDALQYKRERAEAGGQAAGDVLPHPPSQT